VNTEIRLRWAAALRSGAYPQGRHQLCTLEPVADDHDGLRRPVDFCCLGVLSELAADAGVVVRVDPDEANVRGYVDPTAYPHGIETNYLHPAVRAWAGIDERDPYVRVVDEPGRDVELLSSLNDSSDYTFADVAALLERGDLP
jgi:hypothetical protein